MTDKTDALVAEVDALLETQGRLMFARKNYNEAQAEAFGVRLLDFMRLHGEKVRAALAAPAEGGQGEVRLWDSQWVNIVNHPEVLNAEDQETAVSVAVRMTETAIAKNVADGKLPPVTRKLIDSAGGAKGITGSVSPQMRDANACTPQPAEGDGAVLWINSKGGQITPAEYAVLAAERDASDYRPLVYGDTRPPAAATVPSGLNEKTVRAVLQEVLSEYNESLSASAWDELVDRFSTRNTAPTPPAVEGLTFLLLRIGSWTNARWDQHLRHEFGDERAEPMIAAITALAKQAAQAGREAASG